MEAIPIKDKLKTLVNSQDMSDVLFLVGKNKTKIYAHKLILSLASKTWKQLFYQEQSPPKLIVKYTIPDIEEIAFKSLLNFCYTKQIKLSDEIVLDLYYAANKFEVEELIKICEKYLGNNLSLTNCLIFLERSLVFNDKELIQKSLNMIEEESIKILNVPKSFNKLKEQTVKVILSCKKLNIDEIEIFRRIYERGIFLCSKQNIKPNPETLTKILSGLLDLIHIDLIGPTGLIEIAGTGLFDYKFLFKHSIRLSQNLSTKFNQNFEISRRQSEKSLKDKSELSILLLFSHVSESYYINLMDSIKSTGIKKVDLMKIFEETPTIEKMKNYDAVFVFSDSNFKEPIKAGNVLAEYVQGGGGLVISTLYSLTLGGWSGSLEGAIVEKDFLPVKKAKRIDKKRIKLGEIIEPNHYIMKNVTNFDCGNESLHTAITRPEKGANVISRWNDGTILVATKKKKSDFGIVVVLNFYPISDAEYNRYWSSQTDASNLIANSVEYAANY
ncbi:btb (poz) domain-containing 2a-related [Anaeramoeba flamelloides]|uniref:Btb (Poz) domain-containing 2a-related n=1 Tax=Anaeramoeba flamelloides TaxID=1746091 RepID=A0ABQ8Z5S9_9EUKA|nr:btb (poz) domain-containing 2a-related [Anaeramoeba flamelloides]